MGILYISFLPDFSLWKSSIFFWFDMFTCKIKDQTKSSRCSNKKEMQWQKYNELVHDCNYSNYRKSINDMHEIEKIISYRLFIWIFFVWSSNYSCLKISCSFNARQFKNSSLDLLFFRESGSWERKSKKLEIIWRWHFSLKYIRWNLESKLGSS